MFSLRPVVFALLSVMALLPLSLSAAVLEGLYRVEHPQLEEESREEALRRAAEVMLRRIAGDEVNMSRGPVAEALKDPRTLMRRIGGAEGGQVNVEFEPATLRELMASAGQPMLGRNRPAVLVWAVEARTLGDELIGQGTAKGEVLRTAAAYRGVALTFPMGDLEDRTSISEADVRERQRSTLIEASQRYEAEGTLALSFDDEDEQSRLTWSFWLLDQEHTGRASGTDPQAAADEMMRAIADVVFKQYAVPVVASSELTRWTLIVQDVNSLDDYALLQRMLQQLGSQSVPNLLAVDADRVTIELDYPGSEAQLERMLMLGQRLVRVEEPQLAIPESSEPILLPEPMLGADGQWVMGELPEGAAPVIPVAPEPDPSTLYYRWR